MGCVLMETMMTRGAAVALLAFGFVMPVGAQSAGAGAAAGAVRVRAERAGELRDSAEVRTVMMTKARLDSAAKMMREFSNLPRGSEEQETMRKRIDALMSTLPTTMFFRENRSGPPAFPKGWIGIHPQGPNYADVGPDGYVVQYFDYPAIVSVDPESPAKRAGIVPGDVLLAYDGVDVKGHRFDLTQMLVPEKKLSVAVRHDGESKEFTLVVAEAPPRMFERQLDVGSAQIRIERNPGDPSGVMAVPRGGGGFGGAGAVSGRASGGMIFPSRNTFFITPNGAFGAILSTVSPELAKTLKLETGVLVNDVTDETPAFTGGLKTGDVIVSVAGQSVTSLKALQEIVIMRKADRAVVLDVVRDKRPRKITVSW
jgi:C-terminal processing protease CtpA/Prc